MKRSFLLKASTAHTAPDFDVRQVASTSGRLDIVCRCVLATFTGAKGIRPEVDFTAILEGPPRPPLALQVSSERMKNLPEDEVAVAAFIFEAMQSRQSHASLSLSRESFPQAVRRLRAKNRPVFYLHEDGEDLEVLRDRKFAEVGFIIGDQVGLDAHSERFLDSVGVSRVSLGPRSYLSSSCIIFVNSFLDALEG